MSQTEPGVQLNPEELNQLSRIEVGADYFDSTEQARTTATRNRKVKTELKFRQPNFIKTPINRLIEEI